jgi:hypothetical protein
MKEYRENIGRLPWKRRAEGKDVHYNQASVTIGPAILGPSTLLALRTAT